MKIYINNDINLNINDFELIINIKKLNNIKIDYYKFLFFILFFLKSTIDTFEIYDSQIIYYIISQNDNIFARKIYFKIYKIIFINTISI